MPIALYAPTLILTLTALLSGYANEYFVPNACERLRRMINENIVGQEVAKELIISTICKHLSQENPEKPLVFSVHGPPGIGKTFTHTLTAKALYGISGDDSSLKYRVAKYFGKLTDASEQYVPGTGVSAMKMALQSVAPYSVDCPGLGCPAYKILYGMNYLNENKDKQYEELRKSIAKHLKRYKESIIVIEELDKLTCDTRAFFRQFLNHPHLLHGAANSRSIIFFESNLGMHEMIEFNNNKNMPILDIGFTYHNKIKKLLYEFWNDQECNDGHTDVYRTINHIDLFIPYFPLNKDNVRQLIKMNLDEVKQYYGTGRIFYDDKVINHLLHFVQFDGESPVNGAKDVEFIVQRYVGQALRELKNGRDDNVIKNKELKLILDRDSLKFINIDKYSLSIF